MIKARRFLEMSPSALLFVSPISRFPTKAAESGCRPTWLGICRSGGCASDPTGGRFCLTCVGRGKRRSHNILLQQIDRYSEENHVLHQKRNIARHRRKPCSRIPAVGHEWDDGDGVEANVTHEPRAPRMPNFLFQNPRNRSAQISHSDTPENQLAPRIPRTGYIQKIRGPLLMYGISTWASYSNHF